MVGTFLLSGGLAAFLAAADPAVTPPPAPPASAPAGQIRGSVSYGRHEPAAGAIVLVRPESAPSPIYAATTGASGVFAFDGLADGSYRAEVLREGYSPVVKSGIRVRAPFRAIFEVLLAKGTAPPEGAAAAIEGDASLAGRVRMAGGAPAPEVRVRLTRADGTAEAKTAVTDAAGAFALAGLEAGRWRLAIQGAGLLPLRVSLDLAGDVVIEARLAAQPADYRPSPQDLLAPEDVIPPPAP